MKGEDEGKRRRKKVKPWEACLFLFLCWLNTQVTGGNTMWQGAVMQGMAGPGQKEVSLLLAAWGLNPV